ncbi:MAG: acyltransferase family protein, partial [Oscillospiraceae bacterium]|nr:acyltransferase family protein [Oscillospiraceae bacterium]
MDTEYGAWTRKVAGRMPQNTLANQGRKRDTSLDIIKGLDILLVVYVHTLPFCRDFIHVLAIPLFLLVSGYCWHAKISSWKDFGRFTLKRFKALYIPFV